MRRPLLVGGWVVVVALATTLTWQVVGAVDDQVSTRPVSPLNVSGPVVAAEQPTTTAAEIPSTTTLMTTGTLQGSSPTSSTTTTTSPEASTTTTTVAADWQTKSTTTAGGTVVVKYRPGEVVLLTATPEAGFRVEIEYSGPPEVEVDFESDTLKVEYRARWEDGELDIEVKESDEE